MIIEMPLDSAGYFDIYRNMKTDHAVAALAALAQDNRLDVYRLLVQAGPDGMAAGQVAERLASRPIRSRSTSTDFAQRAWSLFVATAAR